jgi:hypothetical protein
MQVGLAWKPQSFIYVVDNLQTKENLPFKNALLTTIISNGVGPFQRFISRTIGGIKYLLGKVVMTRMHVDVTNDNTWGGLPRKRI